MTRCGTRPDCGTVCLPNCSPGGLLSYAQFDLYVHNDYDEEQLVSAGGFGIRTVCLAIARNDDHCQCRRIHR